jgi:hypothetical protein
MLIAYFLKWQTADFNSYGDVKLLSAHQVTGGSQVKKKYFSFFAFEPNYLSCNILRI